MEMTRREREAEEGMEDMINLGDLNETTILHNLRTRYGRDHIYTYIGSILVAVNPYRTFNMYGLDMVQRYQGQQLGDLPPHLFAVGSASYSKMVKEGENQVLVISGESGAGKTESTKLVMQYLAAVNQSGNNLITEQILEANPLLESFGNAKTIRNDNSSRFGKYIEVFFNNGAIVGARTLEYLLEKSRIVTQAPEERNYHVFYEMLEALTEEEKARYGLQSAPKYFYLNQGGSAVIPGRDDAQNFRKLTAAMDVLSFTRDEQETIHRILASVLHLGNIYFTTVHENNHDRAVLGSDAELRWVCHLLQLSEDWLQQALVSKVTEARGDRVVSPFSLDQALDARDAMAKALYSRQFTWLVERVNLIICRAEREKTTSLAVLDIFGFEDFQINSFEQLCINYANETLQYFFNQHIFQLEQKEYSKERIAWHHIHFKDNQPTIDLIATKPLGILHLLDDECNFPQSKDHSFLEKCHFHHSSNPLYDKPRMSDPEFYITHYAGTIRYDVSHFLEKNKDTLRSDVVELMCESKNKMIADMFRELRDRQAGKTLSKTTGRYVTMKPRTPTVAASFNESLLSLIDTMSRCHPYFIRCVKPNSRKAAMTFEDQVVLDQLRYTGMLETIRIRKMGYPIRVKFHVFLHRYRCLLRGQPVRGNQTPSEVCDRILANQGPAFKDQYQIGLTKVFMKETFEIQLDTQADSVQRSAAVLIQSHTRCFLTRHRFLRTLAASRTLQRVVRMRKARRQFLATRNGIIRAQAQCRMFLQRKRYRLTREEIRRQLEEEKLARRRQEVHDRQQREQRERQARAMANIVNLEIPAELAFVFSKLDDWRPAHDGKNIITAVGHVQSMDMGYRLPIDINSHQFSKYTSVYFKDPQWGVKMEPVQTSLTPVQTADLDQRAVGLFKLVLRYMCETNMSEKREKVLADYIVQMGLQHEGVRDELLCQLVNQTWQNQKVEQADRVWRLLCSCLCCFMPSTTLFKYLLKYVSDVDVNAYKNLCQHKVLQSANLQPQFSRIYPPCFLEWRAIQRKANMALEVKFPDDINVVGHVESWTSGELLASHLLKQRGVKDNTQGWTLLLQDDVELYELLGYDYALDLLSEMEVAPGFPHRHACFLVSTDRTQERLYHRRHHEGPHTAEQERVLKLLGQLPPMVKRTTPVVSAPTTPRPSDTSTTADDMGFSTTSVLNQRPTDILPVDLSDSRMNQRYKRRAPPPPDGAGAGSPAPNGHLTDGDVSTHVNGDVNGGVTNGEEVDLSRTNLNSRYFTEPDPSPDTGLSSSHLNLRYIKKATPSQQGARKSVVQDQIRKRQMSTSMAADAQSMTSEHSDWSQWVADVFRSALDEHDDGVSEGRSLHTRIKGGGRGVPGIQTQQDYEIPTDSSDLQTLTVTLTQPDQAHRLSAPLNQTPPSHLNRSLFATAEENDEMYAVDTPSPASPRQLFDEELAHSHNLYQAVELVEDSMQASVPNPNQLQNPSPVLRGILKSSSTSAVNSNQYSSTNENPNPIPIQDVTLNSLQTLNLNANHPPLPPPSAEVQPNPLQTLNRNANQTPGLQLNPMQVLNLIPNQTPPPPPPPPELQLTPLQALNLNPNQTPAPPQPLPAQTLPLNHLPTPNLLAPLLNASPQYTTIPPPLNLGLGLTTPTNVVAPPMVSPAFAFTPQLTTGLQPHTDALQQLVTQQAAQQALQQQAVQQQAAQVLQQQAMQQQAAQVLQQQAMQQQAAQQQAAEQAAVQSLLLQQEQQRQQQQALLQVLTQQQQQQQQQQTAVAVAAQTAASQLSSVQAVLKQTELENKLLKQSIERENLRKQLQQLQQTTSLSGVPPLTLATQPLSPDASYSSGMAMPPGLLPSPTEAGVPLRAAERGVPAPSKEGPAVAPKRVSFLKSAFESQQAADQAGVATGVSAGVTTGVFGATRTAAFTATSAAESEAALAVGGGLLIQQAPSSPPPPPPPPPPPGPSVATQPPHPPPLSPPGGEPDDIYMDGFSEVPPLHSQPQTPFPPPPPPPPPPPVSTVISGLEIDKDKGTFTIRDKDGRARTVRIGKVVWPPPSEETEKKEVRVGKLEIDEKVARGIENRIVGKKKWQKPSAPEHQQQQQQQASSILKKGKEERTRKAKSLVESSSHFATLKLLEKKLGGRGGGEPSEAEAPPPTRPLPPVPVSQPVTKTAESISVQTTDTLKRSAAVTVDTEEEDIYASAVVADEPPPVPKHPPPPMKTAKKAKEKSEKFEKVIQPDSETFETVIRSDTETYEASVRPDQAPEVFQNRIEADVEPPKPPQIDYAAFERVVTELFPQNKKHFLMYNKVPWVLHIRKEVFWPSERLDNLSVIHLIYCQMVHDVYNNGCVRITKDQRVKMRSMLEGHGVNRDNYLTKELPTQVKKILVDTAKEWPTYFCRLFPVAGEGHYAGVRYLGVSHTGLRLITREQTLVDDHLVVVEDIRFEDMVEVVLPNSSTIQLNLRTKTLLLQTPRAQQLKDMVDRFCQESEKGNKFVVVVKDYQTRESTLLNLKRGDIIKMMDPEIDMKQGWLYGSLNGIVGLFPEECVRPLARHEVETSNMKPKLYQPPATSQGAQGSRRPSQENGMVRDDGSETSQVTAVTDGKFSMMEFALLHFRQSLDKYEMLRTEDGSIRGTVKMIETIKMHEMQRGAGSKHAGEGSDWSWKEQADMIKWTQSPIQASLLKLTTSEMNKLALECFIAIMQFMGDYPMGSNQTDYDCVMRLLKSCHKYPELKDEVYCQLCKQTTSNRSMKGKSKVKGWRLFALVAAYCDCSDLLRPYLFKYLENTAADVNRTYNHAAALCLQNLRKTFKYGGRKNVPLREEVNALAEGRHSKRFSFFYSGANIQGGVLQAKSCTVVQDTIVEACTNLGVTDTVEMEEYTLFVRTERDGVFNKLNHDEYILDVTAEFVRNKIPYDLIFQRTVFIFPLVHMDNEIYTDMMFHQCIFDYMDGLLLERPGGQPTAHTLDEVVMMAALLHRANGLVGLPTLKQLEVMVPRTLRSGPSTLPPQQWLNRIQERQRDVGNSSTMAAKALFLEMLSKWSLFGSTFFLVKSVPNMSGECNLAINKRGLSFLRRDTHETMLFHPFSEILSTRRYVSDSGDNYLDMKIGDLMVQKILRIETDQGSDISNLIGQYMHVINRQHRQNEPL